MFDTGKAELHPKAEPVLVQVLVLTRRYPGPVQVDGFTDSEGSPQTNLVLSERRAAAVAQWLVGAESLRSGLLDRAMVRTGQFGDNSTTQGRQRNRRVEVAVKSHGGRVWRPSGHGR